MQRALTDEERRLLAGGEADLPDLVARALLRRVEALRAPESRRDPEALEALENLLRLLDALETPVPWKVRTSFWEAWEEEPPDSSPLRRLARELGFAVEKA